MMNNNCYFFLNNKTKCVWGKMCCFLCSYKIKPIEGMDNRENMKDYVNIVISKNNSKRAFLISIIALIVSLSTLFLNYIDKSEKIKDFIPLKNPNEDVTDNSIIEDNALSSEKIINE